MSAVNTQDVKSIEKSISSTQQFEKRSKNTETVDVLNKWILNVKDRIASDTKGKKRRIALIKNEEIIEYDKFDKRDNAFLMAFTYLLKNNPERNDLIRYLSIYMKHNHELQQRFFKYDLVILEKYMCKAKEKKELKEYYNPFDVKMYRNYVVYMCLKLLGEYTDTDDIQFNVSTDDSREFNPLTKIASVLRGFLPFKIKEFDIKRAFPSFIDIELNINYRDSIYEILTKQSFAKAVNANSDVCDDYYYEEQIKILKKVYGHRAYHVLTRERFISKGQAYRDFSAYEKIYINKFIYKNKLVHYVRLHDGIFVLDNELCPSLTFGIVEFVMKDVLPPKLREDADKLFYEVDEDINVLTSPTSYSNFMMQEGFLRVSTTNDKNEFVKDNNNVVTFFNYKTDLLKTLEKSINEYGDLSEKIQDLIATQRTTVIANAFALVDFQTLTYYNDKEFTFALPFKNGLFEMDKLGTITKKEYRDVNGFFMPHVIQSRCFVQNDEVGDFEKFIYNISGKDRLALMCIIGYLVHSYKDRTCSPGIILTDEDADDVNRKGGKGKSLLGIAIGEVVSFLLKGGKEFDPTQLFAFDDLKKGTRVYNIDDVPAGFKYDDLYTHILGGISCQRKGLTAEAIPFDESPKFLMTSNWLVPFNIENNSTNRRFVEFKFNSHYGIHNTPLHEFGRRMFSDWDEVEYNRFYSFIFRCVKLFFDNGLIKPIYNKEVDNYLVKFRNEAFETEFERILKPMLLSKTTFKVSDFLQEYKHFENPFKNENWFHQNNVRDLIDIWLKHSNNAVNYKYWSYSKSHKAWFYNDTNLTVKLILDS